MDATVIWIAVLGFLGGLWYWIRRSRGRGIASDATAGSLMSAHIATGSFHAHDTGYHGGSGYGDVGAGGAGGDSGGV